MIKLEVELTFAEEVARVAEEAQASKKAEQARLQAEADAALADELRRQQEREEQYNYETR